MRLSHVWRVGLAFLAVLFGIVDGAPLAAWGPKNAVPWNGVVGGFQFPQ